jgi:alpha-D-xyloside xylohydrolase
MKFSNGYWLPRDGWTVERARQIQSVEVVDDGRAIEVFAPVRSVETRGDVLNTGAFTVRYRAVAPGVLRVDIVRWRGRVGTGPALPLSLPADYRGEIEEDGTSVTLRAEDLTVTVRRSGGWEASFASAGRHLTSSLERSVGLAIDPRGTRYTFEQLGMAPGERIHGMGERFGAFTKNGQSVDIWNEDGGTSSEQAYKNVPLYLSTAGYGVLVLDPGDVSFEVASEAVSRAQFSVRGDHLAYLLIDGPTGKDVLERYTAITGRPPAVPAWSYGLWLTTSFTTSYDEQTVTSFVDGMAARGLPLSVFHFDCFWMRGFHWTDFVWDPDTFPDPRGMLARLKERGLRICVWINPYIAQRSRLWDEGARRGYLLRTEDGGIWQTDMWQAGMSLVDFTNPQAVAWYQNELRAVLDMGVDCFKTDFGERVPVTGVRWSDGADPVGMHNMYSYLYNRTVFEVLREARGEGEAVLFARSATVGGQSFPVHWGGDCESTFASMGETLRGGLSLAMSGFGYWSHDIGGFEGTPDPGVFKRWLAFGLLSSHSRLHGSDSVRVPWAFDEEAVEVTRTFTHLKMRLMPYLGGAARDVREHGTPIMRPMVLEFPGDRGTWDLDTQYMLGPDLLVAPVFTSTGDVDVYLPEGEWTSLLTGRTVRGPRWVHEVHGFSSLPLYARGGAILPLGSVEDRPDYDWADGVTLRLFAPADGRTTTVVVPASDAGVGAQDARFLVARTGEKVRIESDSGRPWAVEVGGARTECPAGTTSCVIALGTEGETA